MRLELDVRGKGMGAVIERYPHFDLLARNHRPDPLPVFALREVQQTVGHPHRRTVGRQVVQPHCHHALRLVDRESQSHARRSENLEPGGQTRAIEAQ